MSGRIFFGGALVVLGLGFLLDQLGVIEFGALLGTYWPLFLIAFGVLQLATRGASNLGAIILIAIGVVLQAQQLELLPGSVWRIIWPVGLIVVGAWLVFNRLARPAEVEASAEDRINAFIAFGGINPRNNSGNFSGGSVTALFGGAEIDLRDAQLNPDGATLDLSCAFGGIEVWIPEDWQVEMSGLPIFGAWEDNTRTRGQKDPGMPTLKVSGFVAFGGLEVKN